MGTLIATCGHDITEYPWDWPPVWTLGLHGPDWSYSVLCFPCIMQAMTHPSCVVQFTLPETFKAGYPHTHPVFSGFHIHG